MQLNLRKSLITTAVAGGIVAVSATAAFAYWTAAGSGTGSAATAAESQPLTIAQTSTNAGLVPGGEVSTITGTITNPNPFPVPINTITATPTVGASGCQASWFTVSGLSAPATVPANNSVTFSGSIRMTDSGTNQDACKGVTVNLAFATT
jgi:hypothetical protein